MKEKDIQKKIMQYLKTVDGYFFKIAQGPYSMIGIADIIGVYEGRFIALEVKAEKGKLTVLQDRFLRKVRSCRGVADVVRSVDDVRDVIEGIF